MSLTSVVFYSKTSGGARGKIDLPNECPWCHQKVKPTIIAQNKYEPDSERCTCSVLLECPDCFEHFHASYSLKVNELSDSYHSKKIDRTPSYKSSFVYPKAVDQICVEFKEIISQTTQAEGSGLYHLAGIGYRKSIEFLVKDYLIELKEFDRETTEKLLLGQCINKIEDPNIKALSKAATWIGNDETHYVRRHDKNIENMKEFLHALTYLVSLEKTVREAKIFTEDQ